MVTQINKMLGPQRMAQVYSLYGCSEHIFTQVSLKVHTPPFAVQLDVYTLLKDRAMHLRRGKELKDKSRSC